MQMKDSIVRDNAYIRTHFHILISSTSPAYQFLDPKTEHGLLAAYVVGIAVGECVIFALVYGICYLRERISAKLQRGRDDGELGQPEEIDEWEEVESPHLPSMAQV